MATYRIVRFYREPTKRSKTIVRGLTLKEAQHHCSSDDTHHIDKEGNIEWFDGYTKE